MADVNSKGRLPYRQWQALETKRRIARAARRVFAEGGYAASSIELVAREAGVAARTVYAAFGGKKPILAMICDQWLAESDVAGIAGQLMAEPDARRRLDLIAHLNRRQWELGQDVVPILEAAAAADVEVARMLAGWKHQRAAMIREAIKPLAGKLRAGVKWQDASAAVRALSAAEIYSELVGGEGWSPDRYQAWLADLLATEFLGR